MHHVQYKRGFFSVDCSGKNIKNRLTTVQKCCLFMFSATLNAFDAINQRKAADSSSLYFDAA